MRVGFTGTRRGMNEQQRADLAEVLKLLGPDEFHHGDCIGADCQAHMIAKSLGYHVVVHSPIDDSKRAFKRGDEFRDPKPYLDRNHDIVDDCDIVIATPFGLKDLKRGSGTWATIHYAWRRGTRLCILWPNGEWKLP